MNVRRHDRTFTDPSFPLIVTRKKNIYSIPNFLNIHWQRHFEFCYIADGEFELYDPQGNQFLQTGDLCIFSPGDPHCIRCTQGIGEFWLVHFTPELLAFQEGHFFDTEFTAPLRDGTLRLPKLIRGNAMSPEMLHNLQQLLSHKEKTIRLVAMLNICVQLLPLCSRQATQPNPDQPSCHPAVVDTQRYINANYVNQLNLQELADRVHLHPNYLCALWKKEMGQTIFEYQNRLRVYRSRDMLRQHTYSVVQIADALGFPSADFFRKKFRQLIGLTPTQYRKHCNG